MLIEEIKNIKSDKKELKKFGITIGIVLAILAGFLLWREKDTYKIFMIISAAFILLGLILPTILKPLQKAWMILAVVLGWFMTRVILSILFYLVFTTIGLGGRLLGKKFLDLKMDGSRESYWINREKKPFSKGGYERQF
jgi:hypothetical protein